MTDVLRKVARQYSSGLLSPALVLAPDYRAYRAWRRGTGAPGSPFVRYLNRAEQVREAGPGLLRLVYLPYYDEHPRYPAIREAVNLFALRHGEGAIEVTEW